MGRTGKLFAHEWAGITPDVMAVAKGIGGGFPVGAFMATKEAAKGMVAGTHGSTFGGNPLAMAVGNAVLDAVLEPGFLDHVQAVTAALQAGAGPHQGRKSRTSSRRCAAAGLLTGIKVKPPDGRGGQRLHGREAAHGRRRRERRAPAAAAQRHRGGDHRRHAQAVAGALRRLAKPAP